MWLDRAGAEHPPTRGEENRIRWSGKPHLERQEPWCELPEGLGRRRQSADATTTYCVRMV